MLVMPISVIMLFKYGPYWLEDKQILEANNAKEQINLSANQFDTLFIDSIQLNSVQKPADKSIVIEPEDLDFPYAFSLLTRMMFVSIALGFAWNYPFKLYFRKKRRLEQPSAKLELFCRKWLLKVPHVNALIIGFGFATALTFMAFEIYGTSFKSDTTFDFFQQFFFISTLGAILTIIFVYFWFRHRVRFIYLEHVFDSVSLYKTTTTKYRDHIVRRLWINSLMTTLLPLTIVIFYLSLTKTFISEVGAPNLNKDQITILFGKYVSIIDQSSLFQSEHLFYVNAIDSLLMFIGIFTGILISIIYLFFFVNWTHYSIVIPLREVVEKMRQPIDNELDRLAILRTDDEIGELANGYNEMALRITNNIRTLSQITEANQRFVPVQFLQMLDKESITDVSVGDQIQKVMTVLFVDIRSFTALSEQLSPKENFDFLNEYLGFMEPVIRAHHGFVDKFIGDSIMALFHKKPEDAIDAAIEMREQLKLFNERLIAEGKPPIETGAGIHTGILILGVVGGEGRMETTVISDAVNLASRLEGLTRTYNTPIIVSEATIFSLATHNSYKTTFIDEVFVKGRTGSVKIYSIDGHCNEHEKSTLKPALDERITRLKTIVTDLVQKNELFYPYHNLAHTMDVFQAATHSGIYHSFEGEELIILQSAALLHETGMSWGTENHEEKSTRFAEQVLPELGFNPEQVNRVNQLIMATKMPQEPFDLCSSILCDSDLDYLGRPDYVPISSRLREEWIMQNGYPSDIKVWLKTQFDFLSQHQYFTDFSRQRRESKKNENLVHIKSQLAMLDKMETNEDKTSSQPKTPEELYDQ